MSDHLAAIREAARKILDATAVIGGNRIYREEMQSIAQCVLRILDEAEKDSTCKVLFTDFGDPYCSECGSREIHSCDTNYCPDCGRRIVKEDAE